VTEDEQIAVFIAEHGVTRCPTAVAAPTHVDLDDDAVAFHRARTVDPVGEQWRGAFKAARQNRRKLRRSYSARAAYSLTRKRKREEEDR
jgi:hypothetical protein